jgi:large subunit ribosomal protein L9
MVRRIDLRVIFLEDIPGQANAGDVRNVADGYARNYLIPKKLAITATAEEMKRIERIKRAGDERRIRETQQWSELARLLEGTSITVKARATPAGHFYGAITPGQIAEGLAEAIGRDVDRKLVETVEPIRDPGEYDVALNLAPGIQATIIVTAEAQE